jgi:hypothetical protein
MRLVRFLRARPPQQPLSTRAAHASEHARSSAAAQRKQNEKGTSRPRPKDTRPDSHQSSMISAQTSGSRACSTRARYSAAPTNEVRSTHSRHTGRQKRADSAYVPTNPSSDHMLDTCEHHRVLRVCVCVRMRISNSGTDTSECTPAFDIIAKHCPSHTASRRTGRCTAKRCTKSVDFSQASRTFAQ